MTASFAVTPRSEVFLIEDVGYDPIGHYGAEYEAYLKKFAIGHTKGLRVNLIELELRS